MDYQVHAFFEDGYFEDLPCATHTDVENTVVELVRRSIGIRQVVHISVIPPKIKENQDVISQG